MNSNRSIRINSSVDQTQWDNFSDLKNNIEHNIDCIDKIIIEFYDSCPDTPEWAIKSRPWIQYIFQLITCYCSIDVIKQIHDKYIYLVPYPKTLLKIYSKMSHNVSESTTYKKLNDIKKLYEPTTKLKFYDESCRELIFQIISNVILNEKNLQKLTYLLDTLPVEWYVDTPIFMSKKIFIAATSEPSQCTTSMYHELYKYFGEKHCISQWIIDAACYNKVIGIIEWYKAHTRMSCSIETLYIAMNRGDVNATKTILLYFPSSEYNLIDMLCERYHNEKAGFSNIKALQPFRQPWLLQSAETRDYKEIIAWFKNKKLK